MMPIDRLRFLERRYLRLAAEVVRKRGYQFWLKSSKNMPFAESRVLLGRDIFVDMETLRVTKQYIDIVVCAQFDEISEPRDMATEPQHVQFAYEAFSSRIVVRCFAPENPTNALLNEKVLQAFVRKYTRRLATVLKQRGYKYWRGRIRQMPCSIERVFCGCEAQIEFVVVEHNPHGILISLAVDLSKHKDFRTFRSAEIFNVSRV